MKKWLHRIVAKHRTTQTPDRMAEVKPLPPAHHLGASRWIAAALERAMQCGQWQQAARLVVDAGRLGAVYPHLTEVIARFHLASGYPENALQCIDGAHVQTASLRLLRNVCLVILDRVPDAVADLEQWSKRSTAPMGARTLQALLQSRHEPQEASRAPLRRNLKQLEDPASLAALIALCLEEQRDPQAAHWAERLQETLVGCDDSELFDVLLKSLSLARPMPAVDPAPHQIRSLALEVLGREDLVPVLVAAQEIEYDERSARLLAAAVEQALPDMEGPALAYEALSRLALAASNEHAAGQWLARGLAAHPMSADLVRWQQQFEIETSAEIPTEPATPSDVLAVISPDTETRDQGKAA